MAGNAQERGCLVPARGSERRCEELPWQTPKARKVHLFGEEIPVDAKTHTIGGFSAHADRYELLAWHRATGRPAQTVLIQGEAETMRAFAAGLKRTDVVMPNVDDTLAL